MHNQQPMKLRCLQI